MSRKSLKVDGEIFDALEREKRQYETWNAFFDRVIGDGEAEEQARGYAELETVGDLRSFERIDTFGVPGGTVVVFLAVDANGDAFWVVDGTGFVNIYPVERWQNLEPLVQAHADTERRLIAHQNDDGE